MSENRYTRLVNVVTEALIALGEDRAHQSTAIRAWVQENRPNEWSDLSRSWANYLSAASSDTHNRIERTPGKYTYFLRTDTVHDGTQATTEEECITEDGSTDSVSVSSTSTRQQRQERESVLYPPLADWVRSRGFRARITSSSRRGKIWGNPDVTGLKVVEGYFGNKDLEITTVEAKVSLADWRHYFFESVAHKRFSHRAYFVFAVGSDEPTVSAINDVVPLREYGEKYGVGIAVVFLPVSTYDQLTKGNIDGLNLTLDEIRIEEIWPASYDFISPAARVEFLENTLGLADDAAIYSFDNQ